MVSRDLFVLMALPPRLRAAFGEERARRLDAAHPRVEVALVERPDEIAALLPRADGAIILPALVPLLAPALQPPGRLRWIHSVQAGVEELLTPEVLAAEHIALTATKGPHGAQVAEHALMLMLALARDFPGYVHSQDARHWGPPDGARSMGFLAGRTVAILGVGDIGGQLARICRAGLGMRVLGLSRARREHPHVDRYVERAELPGALGEADFVVVCLALTPETARIIDAAALAAMKPTAYLINVARGGLVDEEALVAALQAGTIAGAGLDTMATEPLPAESPLWAMPNVLLTPHVAPGDVGFMDRVAAFLAENIRRFGEGEPLLGGVDRRGGY